MIRSTARTMVAVVALSLVLVAGACSKSSSSASSTTTTTSVSAAYCASWQGVVDSFTALKQVDVIGNGVNALKSAVDALQSSLQNLGTTSDKMFRPKVDAVTSAVGNLADSISSTTNPADLVTKVRDGLSRINSAWTDLVTTLRTHCPSVNTSSV